MRISRKKTVFLDGEDARLHPELTFFMVPGVPKN